MKYYVNACIKIINGKVFRVSNTGTQIHGFDNVKTLIKFLCKNSKKSFRNVLVCDDNDYVIESAHNDSERYSYVKHINNDEISPMENLFLELFYNDKRTSNIALSTYDEIKNCLIAEICMLNI